MRSACVLVTASVDAASDSYAAFTAPLEPDELPTDSMIFASARPASRTVCSEDEPPVLPLPLALPLVLTDDPSTKFDTAAKAGPDSNERHKSVRLCVVRFATVVSAERCTSSFE